MSSSELQRTDDDDDDDHNVVNVHIVILAIN